MKREFSRRDLLQRVILTTTLAPLAQSLAEASEAPALTPLDPHDANASALGFVTDATIAASNPNYHKGEHCGACSQFQGKPSDARAACNIYAGHSVPAKGWCIVWTARSG